MRSDVSSHSEATDASRKRRRHALRLLGRLKLLERKLRTPIRVCSVFSLLFALVNFLLLAVGSISEPAISERCASAIVLLLTIAFVAISLVALEIGRNQLDEIERRITSGRIKSPAPIPAPAAV